MKNIKTLINLGLILFMGIGMFQYTNRAKNNQTPTDSNAGREEWMRERLVDPQTGKIPQNIALKENAFSNTLPKQNSTLAFSRSSEKLNYERRGPNNVGGRTRAFAIDLTNSSTLFAGGVSGGMWRSLDYGNLWEEVSQKNQAVNISCIAQDPRPNKTDNWYFGTGEGIGSFHGGDFTLLGNGLFKSTDKGSTWSALKSTQIENINTANDWGITWSIVVDPSNSAEDEVYVAGNGVIMKSIDGGMSWKKVLGNSSGSNSNYADVKITSTGIVYAALGKKLNQSNAGIWRSVDGENWVNITGSVWPSNYERVVFDIAKSNENTLMFLARTPGTGSKADPNGTGTESASIFKYTFLSGDGSGSGGIWENRSQNIPSNTDAYHTFDTQGNYNMLLRIDPFNEDIVYIGSTNLFRSTDGYLTNSNITQIGGYNPKPFTNREEYRYPFQHPDQHSLVFQKNNSREVFSLTDGGISYTNDIQATDVVWEFKNTGYFTSQFYTVAIDHAQENNSILGGLQDNGTQLSLSNNPNKGWTNPLKSDGAYCAVQDGTNFSGEGIYYMSSQYGSTYKIEIDNDGNSTGFARIDPTPDNANNRSLNFAFINPFELDYVDNDIMYMLFKSGTIGPSRIKIHNNLKSIPVNNSFRTRSDWGEINYDFPGVITSMVSSRSNPQHRLYVGTSTGAMFRVEDANSSNPTVTKLAAITDVLIGRYVSDFAVHPTDADKLLLTFSNYNVYSVFYSEDGGDSWIPVAGNLEDELPAGLPDIARGLGNGPSVRCAAILETETGTAYFVGTSVGLFATDQFDEHKTIWIQQSPELIGNAIIDKFDTRDSDNYLAIATYGNGVYGVNVTSSDLINSNSTRNEKAENQFSIYPNPTNGTINIDLKDSKWSFGAYKLIDELGRLKQEGNLNNLEKVIEINANQLSNGIYYLTLIADEGSSTKKISIKK